jgi:hypothetical protein
MGRGRRRRPYGAEHPELDVDRARGGRSTQSASDGEWVVQQVGPSDREYRCPGCDQMLRGVPHVVAWRTDALVGNGVDGRRHWHARCWERRPARRFG